jgi:hypothetical protein
VVPDHIHPRGMGGAWRDDHPDNIQAVHWWCNREMGSSRGERRGSALSAQTAALEISELWLLLRNEGSSGFRGIG